MKKLMMLSAVLLCLPAAMCQTGAPGIVVRTVAVPTPVPCLPAEEIPAEPVTVAETLTGVAARDLTIVAASALGLRAWGREMHSALTACAAAQ